MLAKESEWIVGDMSSGEVKPKGHLFTQADVAECFVDLPQGPGGPKHVYEITAVHEPRQVTLTRLQ